MAAAADPDTAWSRWLTASVFGHVKSQTKHRPSYHGAVLGPSGRFPSSHDRDDGSSMAGMSAGAKAHLIRWLMALCLVWQPADCQQLRPWVPSVSTASPWTHVWGEQTGPPRRSATAINSDVSSSLVPTYEHGTTWRNAPAWGNAATRRQASPAWVDADDTSLSTEVFTKGTPNAFIGDPGDGGVHLDCHSVTERGTEGRPYRQNCVGAVAGLAALMAPSQQLRIKRLVAPCR